MGPFLCVRSTVLIVFVLSFYLLHYVSLWLPFLNQLELNRVESVDQSVQWEEDWLSAAVVNSHLVCDPTIQQPGFDLPRHSWTLLNRIRTCQGPRRANMHKCSLASSPLCDCREQQTMDHIVDSCPLTKLDGGLLSLHEADEDAISWLKTTATKAFVK